MEHDLGNMEVFVAHQIRIASIRNIIICLPHKVKTQYLQFGSHKEYFLLPLKIPEVISRRSILFHN